MPGIRPEHRWQRFPKRQLCITLEQQDVTPAQMSECFQRSSLVNAMSFEEAMDDDLLRRIIKLYARATRERQQNQKQAIGEAEGGKP
ncbi:hypothetical protein [Endozoicomonas ascidiicola]|uniref:hypothetical protein n=1 Tax=Endozoicomonas ascidiicola TaxID=1698521 RepID=UPI00082C728A|nr:hypothetical protein [Endozoicomonas ascidiicola]